MAKITNQPPAKTEAVEPKTETTVPANVAPAPAKMAEPTSDKLTELRATELHHKQLARTFEIGSDEEEAALMEAYKTKQLIKAEIANIANEAAKLALDAARNERVKLLDNVLDAYAMYISDTTNEAAKSDYEAKREIVANELLAKYATSKPATAKLTNTNHRMGSGDGATKDDIVALHIANVASGMDDSASRKSLEAAGHKRSTVWHAVNNYNKAK